ALQGLSTLQSKPLCSLEKFGKIISLQIGWKNVVLLNGLEAVKEALVQRSEDFADRPPFSLFDHMGIMMARYGHGWKELRRFTLSTLRNFGLGKKSLDQRVTEEAGCLCSAFSHPFNPRFLINSAVGNVMCSLTFGNRFEYNDEKFQRMLHLIEEAFNIGAGIMSQVILDMMPWLLYIPGPHHNVFQPYTDSFDILREIVKEHKETRDPGFTRDFIDAFLEEIEKAKMDPESTFSEDNLIFTVFDMFGAATETTTVTLLMQFGRVRASSHPAPPIDNVSIFPGRVHEEIDKVIGRDRSPDIEDQVNLPYTNAVIYETQRYCDVVFAGVPRTTYRDTEVQGFFIPKGTIILTVLSSVLKDETVWEKPHEFYPEHFLDADGQFVKREAFLPFSAGRRMCLGEQLARKELFLFFTTLLQHFTFHIPEDQPRPRDDGYYVLIHSPDSYELCASPR
uniref:Cytochrome P450 2D15 n=1 Tax=Terrapene triunguis TaxID=2587831 RepID=A0A674IRY0_9SAUR